MQRIHRGIAKRDLIGAKRGVVTAGQDPHLDYDWCHECLQTEKLARLFLPHKAPVKSEKRSACRRRQR